MIPCLIFLNELSYRYDDEKAPAELVRVLLTTFNAIRAIQKIRQELLIAGDSSISKIVIGDGTHSVASLLSGNVYKDEWRFIRGLDQASPGASSWNFNKPHSLQEVTFRGQPTFGMLWAAVTRSLVLSLPLSPPWRDSRLTARLEEMSELAEISERDVALANVSNPNHAYEHRQLIDTYGRDESASSVIYHDVDFFARIYFFDHNPPHFHVCSPADPATTLATFAIGTLDILKGKVTGRLQSIVRQWAGDHKVQLIENWARCRRGQKPFVLNR